MNHPYVTERGQNYINHCIFNMEKNLLGQAVDAACKILCHGAALNSLNTHPLQSLGEPADK